MFDPKGAFDMKSVIVQALVPKCEAISWIRDDPDLGHDLDGLVQECSITIKSKYICGIDCCFILEKQDYADFFFWEKNAEYHRAKSIIKDIENIT